MSKRAPVTPSPGPLENYCQAFDELLSKRSQRDSFRRYLEGLLLPTERNKTTTALANTEPIVGAQHPQAQRLQWSTLTAPLTLSFDGGGKSRGDFVIHIGTTLRFGGGTHELDADSSVIDEGTANFNGTYNVTGITLVSGGTAKTNGITTGQLTLSGGTLAGAGNVTVTGQFRWMTGTMRGSGTTLADGGIEFSTSDEKLLTTPVISTIQPLRTVRSGYQMSYFSSI